MADEIEFAQGIYFREPSIKAPDWVLGNISLKMPDALNWLKAQPINEDGFVKLVIKRSRKTGKAYVQVDDWTPGQRDPANTRSDDEPRRRRF